MKKRLLNLLLIAALALGSIAPALATPTAITAQNPGALLSGAPGAGTLTLTWTAADVANGNTAVLTGNEVIIAWNTHATLGYTCTVTSVADELGRTGDITAYALAAGEIAFIGPLGTKGWQQTNGKVNFAGSNAAVKFAVVKLRGQAQYK